MARPATGSPVWKSGRWWARVTVGGRRRLLAIRPAITDPEARAEATECTKRMADEARFDAEMVVKTADSVLPPAIDVSRHTFTGVYFARAGDWVKIGHTDDVATRISDLQTACPLTIRVLAIAPGGRAQEREFHRRLRAHRERGEWYRLCPELIAIIWNAARLEQPKRGRRRV